eukprot:GHVU01221798.1.p2 GENE.GHVU01221798.1~~GHVU01221798.1.p2  ORF type:complete len:121 (-),score=1.22 GHVU01221798.1:162-524(-)
MHVCVCVWKDTDSSKLVADVICFSFSNAGSTPTDDARKRLPLLSLLKSPESYYNEVSNSTTKNAPTPAWNDPHTTLCHTQESRSSDSLVITRSTPSKASPVSFKYRYFVTVFSFSRYLPK